MVFSLLPPATNTRAQALQHDRIVSAIRDSDAAELRGNVHPLARAGFERGKVSDSTPLRRVTIFFAPSAGQQAALTQLLAEQQDRTSANYHRWITPQEYGGRFGLSQNDLSKVTSWLESRGLAIQEIPASRNAVSFSGSAARVAAAFRVAINEYQVNGERHYANAGDPSIPAALGGIVSSIAGLNDFRPQPRTVRRMASRPKAAFTDGTTDHFLAPADFGLIYGVNPLYSRGIDGTGQRIAVVGQSDVSLGDIREFRSLMGLPAKDPQIVPVPGSADPGMLDGDVQEASLDLEWAGAVARNATIIYVNSANAWDSLEYAVTSDIAPVISVSYGACEPDFSAAEAQSFRLLGQQANAQGQTIVAASGDTGPAACDNILAPTATKGLAVLMPASLPYATAVGGTEFNEGSGTYWTTTNGTNNISAVSYIPEIVWNDSAAGFGIQATGGGASALFTKPMWQSAAGVPNDGVRDVPDVSLSASAQHDGYLICDEDFNASTSTFTPVCPNGFFGGFNAVGGTSASAPAFAGIVALVNQAMNSPQGNINYVLYALANLSPSPLRGISTGNNNVPCQMSPPAPDCPASGVNAGMMGYAAGAGYSMTAGLGSVDASALVNAWSSVTLSPDFDISVSPPSVSLTRGGSSTAQITVNTVGGLTGVPVFACNVPAIFSGVTCSIAATSSPNVFTMTLASSTAVSQLDPVSNDGRAAENASDFARIFAAGEARLDSVGRLAGQRAAALAAIWLIALLLVSRLGWQMPRGGSTRLPLAACACLATLLLGCAGATSGGGSANSGVSGASAQALNAPVLLQLTPKTATLGANGQQKFTATVANSANATVNWSIAPAVGNVSAWSGADGSAVAVYTAPAAFAASQSVTVTATSVADPSKQVSANIVLMGQESGAVQLTGSLKGTVHTVAISLKVN